MKTVVLCLLLAGPAIGQELSGLARLVPEGSAITDAGAAVTVRLALSQAVPWRVRVLDAPPRIIMDFREVDWSALDEMPVTSVQVAGVRAGMFRAGWSRLVLELSAPMVVAQAGMLTGDDTAVSVRLEPATPAVFAAMAGLPEPAEWALPTTSMLPKPQVRGAGPVVVVLDPGHGGLDPGAERGDQTEADLMLTFARALKEMLLRDGGFAVVMTRDEDTFVPLEARISIARAAGAHVFMSLHADALEEGEAVGATIYTLAEDAGDEAAEALAERHDRDDLLAGIDLSAADDLVATVLMDMARTDTAPRTARLAGTLEVAIKAADLRMHRVPQQRAGFSVLKSPDIPSVLVELGFLSSTRDLARLNDENWRNAMAGALVAGLKAWAAEDAALAALRD